MNSKNIFYNRPQPRVEFYAKDNPYAAIQGLNFNLTGNTSLLAYSFTNQIGNTEGSFSLTFHPIGDIFSKIEKLQIVKIYEKEVLVFVGVVRTKQYTASMSGGSLNRVLKVSGHSLIGLINRFYISLDLTACVLTDKLQTQSALKNRFTSDLSKKDTMREVLEAVWTGFKNIAKSYEQTPEVWEILEDFSGSSDRFFDISDSLKLGYPLGSVFNEYSTLDFFSLINRLIPTELYEKYAYIDTIEGNMRLRIREVPFGASSWAGLKKSVINPLFVKSVSLTETDNEVYTVFNAYLNGYPLEEQRLQVLNAQKIKGSTETKVYTDGFKTYGYRPLFISFYGYDSGKANITPVESMIDAGNKLKSYYGRLQDMLKGSLLLSAGGEPGEEMEFINVGERIEFLGGEFYVEGVSHNWTYGANPEVALSLSRGGNYSNGVFLGEIPNIADKLTLFTTKGETE